MSESFKTYELIDRLNLLVTNSKTMPLTNRLMIEKSDLVSLLEQLEDSIPIELKKAKQVIENKERIAADSKREADECRRAATEEAQKTLQAAKDEAQACTDGAQAQATTTVRNASQQANALYQSAQAQANALIADAQQRAQTMLSENEIVQRANAYEADLKNRTQQECQEYTTQVHDSLEKLMEDADIGLAQQLDSLRTLRQHLMQSM